MPVVYVIIGAASQNRMHVSSSENYNMLSNVTGYPITLKICTGGFFYMLNPNLPSDLFSDNSSNTSFKKPITNNPILIRILMMICVNECGNKLNHIQISI